MKDPEIQQNPVKIVEVQPITRRFNTYLFGRTGIDNYVELPLRRACKIFWDKNIRTSGSCANRYNIERNFPACLILDYLSLSHENQEHAQELIRQGKGKMVWEDTAILINISPVNSDTTVEEVQQEAELVAESFHDQSPNWVPISRIPARFHNDKGGYYDEKSGLYYVSRHHKDLIEKHQKKDTLWVPHYSLDQLIRDQLSRDGNVAGDFEHFDRRYFEIDFWVKEKGYYHDPDTNLFYLSEEDCLKFKGRSPTDLIRQETSLRIKMLGDE